MAYKVYQDNELVLEGIEDKECTVDGLKPNTEYSFSVSEVIGDKESARSEPVIITTKYSDVSSVTVAPKTSSLDVGATRVITATVLPSTAKQDVTWSSSNDSVATVNNGTITAVGVGSATITATAEGKTDTATVSVNQPVEGVTIAPKTATLEIDGTQQLTPTVLPANAGVKTVGYVSSAVGIATVSASGLVTAIATGTTTITVTTTDGSKTDTSVITVNAPAVASVTIAPKTATLEIDGTQQLTPTVLPANAGVKTVSYASSAVGIATVSASGLVTAVAAGTASITVTTTNGSKTDTSVITISAPEPDPEPDPEE